MSGNSAKCCWIRDGNSGTVLDTRRVPDPTGPGTGMIFYPWVAPEPDPNETGTGRVFLLIHG
jgi:hypothetical protein